MENTLGSTTSVARTRAPWATALWAGMVGIALSVANAPEAHAEIATGACAQVMDPNNAPSTDPRIDHLTVDGIHVNVLVPPDYRRDRDHGRRYPVLYLFHGAFSDEDSFTTQTDLLSFTAGLRNNDQAIVVMPDGGHLPAGRDWVDGTHNQESFVINTLVPWVDSHYRTLGDRSHRAAAGFSAGGMNAMVFAALHPDVFAAAGSFSGFLDPFDPVGIQIVMQFTDFDNQLCGANESAMGIWGDPDVHPMGWVGHDPRYIAAGLKNTSVYIASGNGVPCDADPNPDPFTVFAEQTANAMGQNFDQALTDAGVQHVSRFRSCGVHVFSNSNQDLREFWPQMLDAFGHWTPSEFDYRTGETSASTYGWNFNADSSRAPEFLDVRGASDDGLQLTGSGTASITTAALFGRGEFVTILASGLGPQVVRADAAGRLSFSVDLGAAHSLEEYTAAEIAAQSSNPHYFTTRNVRFLHAPGGGGCGGH